MCWEQSRRQRTIATSRSDDNRDESRNSHNEKKVGFSATNEPEELTTSPGAPVMEQPRGKPFPLDKLFQERTDTPDAPGVLSGVGLYPRGREVAVTALPTRS